MDKIEEQACGGKKTSFPDWESNQAAAAVKVLNPSH
jgi:hypothetical protein